jgi:hypothetical protein
MTYERFDCSGNMALVFGTRNADPIDRRLAVIASCRAAYCSRQRRIRRRRRMRLRPLKWQTTIGVRVTTGMRLRPLSRQQGDKIRSARVQGMCDLRVCVGKTGARGKNEWDSSGCGQTRAGFPRVNTCTYTNKMNTCHYVNGREISTTLKIVLNWTGGMGRASSISTYPPSEVRR